MTLDPNALPSSNFDLSNWKLQLPIDAKGLFTGKAAEIKALTGYENANYFHTGSDGAVVLAAPVGGATTGGSIYARSELREMSGSAPAEWKLGQGGHMQATMQVDSAPRQSDGTYGKIVVGQVHGGDGQLVRLAWEDGTLFFANDIATDGKKDVHIELLDSAGKQPSVSLNETFSYSIDVIDHKLVVSVVADDHTYSSTSQINNAWDDNSFYFKAGAYLGVNESGGTGGGQVSLFALAVDHSGNSTPITTENPTPTPSTPTPPVSEPPASTPPTSIPTAPTTTTKTIVGTDHDDVLRGKSTNDFLVGGAGNDHLNGTYGHDVLFGGAGNDVFVFDRNASTKGNSDLIKDFTHGQDKISLEDGKFHSLAEGFNSNNLFFGEQAHDANDFIIYNKSTGELFYDRDGSGHRSAQLIATLDGHPTLTVDDFLIL
ncbi:hypothetical protein ABIB57_004411 [Devosia sp. UYZn731]|uniref:polysaccharide lyase family 7 protein n=1 Tax=Devosia sp. UYZn731 TaxID=3156345 RepID=UPI00339748D4